MSIVKRLEEARLGMTPGIDALLLEAKVEVERLRAALKPFAGVVDEEHQIFRGDPEAETVEIGNWAHLRYNDFVRARSALEGEKG